MVLIYFYAILQFTIGYLQGIFTNILRTKRYFLSSRIESVMLDDAMMIRKTRKDTLPFSSDPMLINE